MSPLRGPEARAHLEMLRRSFHTPEGPTFDPVGLVRPYRDPLDQEVAGLLAALLAYGRVAAIRDAVGRVLGWLGESPSAALRAGRHRSPKFAAGFQYRWTSRTDLLGLLESMAWMQAGERSLGAGLRARTQAAGSLPAGLVRWARDLRDVAESRSGPGRGLRFLLPDPAGTGAAKRLHLYLRWMIRP
ncbi:MAG: DUF2400 family protein, partial [Candidatus Eisenbacteria bacterium]|nr:DUF2400 family protein [Candidatus Eisenbacteria bacterium]